MAKIAKRAASLLCVLVLLSSMFVVTALAAWGKFDGGSKRYTGKGTYASSYSTMFMGDGITKITITPSNSKAPNVSMNVQWDQAGRWCPVNLYFSGGKRGTYNYTLKIWNNSKVVATQTIQFTNNVW